jgi:hypothetical protein
MHFSIKGLGSREETPDHTPDLEMTLALPPVDTALALEIAVAD